MKKLSVITSAICGTALFAALSLPTLRADQWDKMTYMTFNEPVQVPGAVLPAGKYMFKLVESPANRYIVQILNPRESHVYATIEAIPNYRLKTPEKTRVSFYEVPVGQPPAVKAWFYPGDNYGRQFIYGKHEASLIAQAAHESVPTGRTTTAEPTNQVAENNNQQSTTTESQSSTTTEQNSVTEQPSTTESTASAQQNAVATEPQQEDQAQVTPPPATTDQNTTPAPDQNATNTDNNANNANQNSLPSTASNWPLVGLIGFGSVASAFAMRKAAGKLN